MDHLSLTGLRYYIKMKGQTNDTNYFKLPTNDTCYRYLQYGILPNLLGKQDNWTDKWASEELKRYKYKQSCYQHEIELLCYLGAPKRVPDSKQIIHPCREMCHDYMRGCNFHKGYWKIINCDYLPSLSGDIPCFYEPIWCNKPPTVNNAEVRIFYSKKGEHSLPNTAQYYCSEGFKLDGNKSVICMRSGQWSIPFQCFPATESATEATTKFIPASIPVLPTEVTESIPRSPKESETEPIFYVLVAVLLSLLAILCLILALRYKIKLRKVKKFSLYGEQVKNDNILTELDQTDQAVLSLHRKEGSGIGLNSISPPKRKRPFDAIIAYHFETDDSFVINQLLPELEETRDFKLCVYSRNFTPGRDIKENIDEAIEGSNSAIIVMSHWFVDSIWCKEEFTHCYIENMKDPAFNLFVIMMQPADTLINISPYMMTCFDTKTYLQITDPELFPKLAQHLQIARFQKNDH